MELLKSSITSKSKYKINGDELICNFPYLAPLDDPNNIEINKEINKMLSYRTKLSDEQFGWYLAGLIEGDGSFSEHDITIAFNIYDTNLAVYIRDRLGEGNTYLRKGNCTVLIFSKKEAIRKIIKLVNGKFYTDYKINFMKKHKYEEKYGINLLPPIDSNKYPIGMNYFMSGFVDADGCFDIKVQKKMDKLSYYPRFSIIKKDTTIINIIQQTFGGSIYKNKINVSEYQTNTKNIIEKYVSYFEKYKLLSTKYINYIIWKKVIESKEKEEHLTEKGKKEILNMKNIMNRKLYNNLLFKKNF